MTRTEELPRLVSSLQNERNLKKIAEQVRNWMLERPSWEQVLCERKLLLIMARGGVLGKDEDSQAKLHRPVVGESSKDKYLFILSATSPSLASN